MASTTPSEETKRKMAVLDRLAQAYPEADCALIHADPFQLLVATILSAQCTDQRVNQVTPVLFRRFPDPTSMAQADLSELEELIRSTGFFRNKAKNIQGASRLLVEEFGGVVPNAMEALLRLPGVARKTANVVLGVWFGLAEGIVVDTHVSRLSGRLGLAGSEDPAAIEKELMGWVPREQWIQLSHRLIHHGRAVCDARKPACLDCRLKDLCPFGQARQEGR